MRHLAIQDRESVSLAPCPAVVRAASWLATCALLTVAGCVTSPSGSGGTYEAGGPAPVFGGDTATSAPDAATGTSVSDTVQASDGTLTDGVADVILVEGDAKADTKPDPSTADTKADTAKVDSKVDSGPEVMAPVCGDASCEDPESCVDCPQDCGACPAGCGDGTCDASETCKECPADCGTCPAACGNGKCEASSENCQSCPGDCGKCPVLCGDGTCDASESCSTCALDCCASQCGNGSCDQPTEDCKTCPSDCGSCPPFCGDGTCGGAETCNTCAADCCGCNPISSQGCKATEQCYLGNDLKPVCAPPGTKVQGASCTGLADCVKGYICVSGQCGKVCDTKGLIAGYGCANGGVCDELSINGTPLPNNLGVCFGGDTCNLVTNVGCASGQSCVYGSATKACVPTGKGGTGAVCKNYADCAATHICVNNESGSGATCLQKCNSAGLTPKCVAPKACQGLATGNPPKAAPDNLGGCF